MEKQFNPWIADTRLGYALIANAVIGIFYAKSQGHLEWGILIGIVLFLAGWRFLQSAGCRSFGIRIEKQAMKDLSQQLDGQVWAMDADVSAGRVGNIDILVTHRQTGRKYVVEIKSFGGLVGQGDKLVKANGQSIAKDIVSQVNDQRSAVGATEVILWCPKSRLGNVTTHREIFLVNGGANIVSLVLNEMGKA